VLIVCGSAGTSKKIASEPIAKHLKHGQLTVTSSGEDLPS